MTLQLPEGWIEIQGTAKIETDDAVLIDFGGKKAEWIPKSQMEDWPDVGANGDVILTEWIAEEKGVI